MNREHRDASRPLADAARAAQDATMPEIARVMGVPRTTLHEWMHRIRQRFEKTGLRDYL